LSFLYDKTLEDMSAQEIFEQVYDVFLTANELLYKKDYKGVREIVKVMIKACDSILTKREFKCGKWTRTEFYLIYNSEKFMVAMSTNGKIEISTLEGIYTDELSDVDDFLSFLREFLHNLASCKDEYWQSFRDSIKGSFKNRKYLQDFMYKYLIKGILDDIAH